MKQLETEIKIKSHTLKMVWRDAEYAIFERWPENHSRPHSWEAVEIQECGDRTFPGDRIVPAHEHLPSPEMWGTKGFTCSSLQDAQNRVVTMRQIAREASPISDSSHFSALGGTLTGREQLKSLGGGINGGQQA